jgi:late competence protein required for DNA uptake (superfamily II DNA/RNA helicase)
MARKPSRAVNHVHRYHRTDIGSFNKKYLVFRCVKPTCTHYIPMHLAEGKLCECNRCGETMILDRSSIQLAKPHCTNCVKRKKLADVSTISEYLDKIIP